VSKGGNFFTVIVIDKIWFGSISGQTGIKILVLFQARNRILVPAKISTGTKILVSVQAKFRILVQARILV